MKKKFFESTEAFIWRVLRQYPDTLITALLEGSPVAIYVAPTGQIVGQYITSLFQYQPAHAGIPMNIKLKELIVHMDNEELRPSAAFLQTKAFVLKQRLKAVEWTALSANSNTDHPSENLPWYRNGAGALMYVNEQSFTNLNGGKDHPSFVKFFRQLGTDKSVDIPLSLIALLAQDGTGEFEGVITDAVIERMQSVKQAEEEIKASEATHGSTTTAEGDRPVFPEGQRLMLTESTNLDAAVIAAFRVAGEEGDLGLEDIRYYDMDVNLEGIDLSYRRVNGDTMVDEMVKRHLQVVEGFTQAKCDLMKINIWLNNKYRLAPNAEQHGTITVFADEDPLN